MRVAAADMSTLPEDSAALRALLLSVIAERDSLAAERDALAARNEQLHHLLLKLKRRQFGAKSERLPEDQLLFAFEEIEATLAGNAAEAGKASPTLHDKEVMRMADEARLRRFAVLTDADNTSPRIAPGLFEEIAKFGEASVRRIYGDFSSHRLKSWIEILQRYAIDPYQQFAYTTGKNASDIALVIDAMDLLHSGRFEGFCLVSSDSDFTRLASRLREQGADVYGFGEQKTPESFRRACRRFIYTENLLPEAQVATPEERLTAGALQPPSAAIPILSKVTAQMETEDGWVALSGVGHRLASIASDFDPRTYGYRKFSDLVRKAGAFDVELREGRGLRIRIRPKTVSQAAARAVNKRHGSS